MNRVKRAFSCGKESFFLFGPRGTGKTTWLNENMKGAYVVDLLKSDIRLRLTASPERLRDMVVANGDCNQIVIDVCSTKEQICRATQYHPRRSRFVSTHPMAGTEYSGPWAAQPGLFDGRACIFCDSEESDPQAVRKIEEMYAVLNMRPLYMRAAQHDVHTAYVSHISHVTSFALALTVLDKEKDEKHIFDLASGGFSSTVRLAKSNADMWVPILTQNHDNVLHVMDTYIEKMKAFRDAVATYDEDKIRELITEANKIKKILR